MTIHGVGKPAGCKLLRVDAEIEGGVVTRIAVRGDFFATPEEGFDLVESRLSGTPVDDLAARFDALLAEEGVEPYGITGTGLAEVVKGAIDGPRV
jgi:lipoate---protein ligase